MNQDAPDLPPEHPRLGRGLAVGFFVVVALLGLSYVAFALTRSSNIAVSQDQKIQRVAPASGVELHINPIQIDVLNGTMEVAVHPELRGTIGTPIGSVSRATTSFTLFIDGATSPEQKFVPGEIVQDFDAVVSLDEVRSVTSFPFDQYSGTIVASADTTATAAAPSKPIPLVIQVDPPGVDGFTLTFTSPRSTPETLAVGPGQEETTVSVARDDNVRFVTFLVALVLIASALAVLAVGSVVVLGRRRVTVEMMAWMAIFPFALIVLRDVVPGNPPSGVAFDIIAYYWTIALVFFVFITCVCRWLITRDAD
jgi:hypothetical protein